jgi:hypothetical protein
MAKVSPMSVTTAFACRRSGPMTPVISRMSAPGSSPGCSRPTRRFDAGAFIALERRGGPRQPNVGRLISAGRGPDGTVIIDELTAERAKEIGVTIGKISHPDIVDVHVALAAAERGHAVLTSDDADITAVGLDLVLVHV